MNSSDPRDPPLINLNFLGDQRDLHDVEAGLDFIETITSSQSLRPMIKQPKSLDFSKSSKDEKKADFINRAVSVYHPYGTCSLGSDADEDPVSLDFKLRGF